MNIITKISVKSLDGFKPFNKIYDVKLDKNNFPYINIGGLKYIINRLDFPYSNSFWELDIVEGIEELKKVLPTKEKIDFYLSKQLVNRLF